MSEFRKRAGEAGREWLQQLVIDATLASDRDVFVAGALWAAKTGDPDRYDVAWSDGVAEGRKEALKNLPRCESCKHLRNEKFCGEIFIRVNGNFGCVLHSELEAKDGEKAS